MLGMRQDDGAGCPTARAGGMATPPPKTPHTKCGGCVGRLGWMQFTTEGARCASSWLLDFKCCNWAHQVCPKAPYPQAVLGLV
jgi:hypothetical protein